MNQEQQDTLITKHLSGDATPEEQAQLEIWVAASSENLRAFETQKKLWNQFQPPQPASGLDLEAGWQNLQTRLNAASVVSFDQAKQRRGPRPWKLALAAALLIGFVGWQFRSDTSGWKEITASPGKVAKVELPDGSLAWIHSGSTLSYHSKFNGNERSLKLSDGRAYFEVVKGKQPFVVYTQAAKVRVLGTQFEVWSGNQKTRVVVSEGRVALTSDKGEVELSRGQMSSCLKGQSPNSVEVVESEAYLAWMQGRFVFKSTPLGDVILDLARHYDAEIRLDESLATRKLTASFEDVKLDTILEEICLTLNLELRLEGGVYNISIKRT